MLEERRPKKVMILIRPSQRKSLMQRIKTGCRPVIRRSQRGEDRKEEEGER